MDAGGARETPLVARTDWPGYRPAGQAKAYPTIGNTAICIAKHQNILLHSRRRELALRS